MRKFLFLCALTAALCGGAFRGDAADGAKLSVKDGVLYQAGKELPDYSVDDVPAEVGGPARHWSVYDTSVYFFGSDGTCLQSLPLEEVSDCQNIIFSPDGKYRLMMGGSPSRPDIGYVLYGTAGEKLLEFGSLRSEPPQWIDATRFAFTRLGDSIREGGSFPGFSYGLRYSVFMHDTESGKMIPLKEATDTANFSLGEIIDNGAAVTIIEEWVETEADWADEEKVHGREIRVALPPKTAGAGSGSPVPGSSGAAGTSGAAGAAAAETAGVVGERARLVLACLKAQDWEKLAGLVHPVAGVTFAPYASFEEDAVKLSAGDIRDMGRDAKKIYTWGAHDGSGEPIRLSFPGYYERFIFDKDFTKAPQSAADRVIRTSYSEEGVVENMGGEFGDGVSFVEFHIPASEGPDGPAPDWASLRLIFKQHEGQWYLIGIMHDQWTV